MDWLIIALNSAGRKDEVIPLLKREAPVTNCYEDLVDSLISAGRINEAEKYAREGFAGTIGNMRGISWKLEITRNQYRIQIQT
jgi:uncharacterized Zn finger protein